MSLPLMDRPADFTLNTSATGPQLALSGDWTAAHLGAVDARLAGAARDAGGSVGLDLTDVRRLDTAGAYAILHALGPSFDLHQVVARPESSRLLELVAAAKTAQRPAPPGRGSLYDLTVRVGRGVSNMAVDVVDTMVFLGHLLVVTARAIVNPRRIRMPALVSLMERAGFDAIPVIATTSFFIGAVVGLLGANMLRTFGAEVFAVELIGIAVTREFNIIIAAVLLAGRSASAFAAEIGSMKMQQEIDAMQVMGVDPFEALVLPRFAALLLTIPLLTFVATIAGLFGGLMVTWTELGLGPTFFFQRLLDNVGVTHFWVALSKAPVMAAVIAGIGCRQGMEVGGDVESLGRRVTSAVVHAIFAIIFIDAAFALMYMELDI
jgi:phospholipid/cholesterol/gamma-HCH transport system permease protein